MKPSLATKLTQLAARLEELDGLLGAPDVTRDLNRYRALSREHAEIAPIVALHRDWQQAERDLASARELLADAEM
jgi:peptide chain release factor 1